MADFISDEEMAKMESASQAAPDFISDADAAKLEAGPLQGDQLQPEQPAPSTFRSIGEGLTMGFSGELAGLTEASLGAAEGLLTGKNAFGNEGRLAALASFIDNYKKGEKTYDDARKLAAEQSPMSALGSELLGGAVTGIATAPALAAKGLGLAAQGAATGGLAGLGKSEADTLGGVAKDVGLGAALGGAFSWGLGKIIGAGGKAVDAIKQLKDGSFKIQVGQKAGDVFKVSRETAQNLATPEAQNALRAELNAQKDGLLASINSDFKATEALKTAGLAEKGALPAKGLKTGLDKAWDKISSLTPEGDEVAVKSAEALKDRFKELNMSLLAKSPTGSYDDVPLAALEKVRGELGDVVFRNKAYDKVPQVKKAATDLWGKLTDVLKTNDIDPITKQAGDLTKGLDAQRALFKIADEVESLPSGDWIKGLANPSNAAAADRFQSMVKPLEELTKKGNGDTLANLASYISKDFNSAVLKARISNMVLGDTGKAFTANPNQILSTFLSNAKNGAAAKVGAAVGELDKLRLLGIPVGRAITAPADASIAGIRGAAPYVAGSISSAIGNGKE